jgi:hypothetical protein
VGEICRLVGRGTLGVFVVFFVGVGVLRCGTVRGDGMSGGGGGGGGGGTRMEGLIRHR